MASWIGGRGAYGNSMMSYDYLLFTMAKKNNTRIESAIEGNIMSVNGLSNGMLCSKYS
jgi:hypothetical protein